MSENYDGIELPAGVRVDEREYHGDRYVIVTAAGLLNVYGELDDTREALIARGWHNDDDEDPYVPIQGEVLRHSDGRDVSSTPRVLRDPTTDEVRAAVSEAGHPVAEYVERVRDGLRTMLAAWGRGVLAGEISTADDLREYMAGDVGVYVTDDYQEIGAYLVSRLPEEGDIPAEAAVDLDDAGLTSDEVRAVRATIIAIRDAEWS